MSKQLSGKLYQEFQVALLDAFPTADSLEQMVRIHMDQNLVAVAGNGTLATVVFNLIKWAESSGQLDKLVQGARKANSGNRVLMLFEKSYIRETELSKEEYVDNSSGLITPTDLLLSSSIPDYCYISYSSTDALDFVSKLTIELEERSPFINIWFNKRDMNPNKNLDIQITEAIQNCRILLFVITEDSVTDVSACRQEWGLAISCKKPIVMIRLQENVFPPAMLINRECIDFATNFSSGLEKLREYIEWLETPEGQLRELKYRLSDAKQALNLGTHAVSEARIQQQIVELELDIRQREKVIQNPGTIAANTEKRILTGLASERLPEKPILEKTTIRFINPIPTIPPNYFQDRSVETRLICAFLLNPSQRLLTVVGRGGIGKTAMVCRLLKHLETGTLPDDLERDFGNIVVNGIVYLSAVGTHRVNFVNMFTDLSQLLSPAQAVRMEIIYKDARISTSEKMLYLLECFSSGQIILLLDNFETAIDADGNNISDVDLNDVLNVILCGPHHTIKTILTTRVTPRSLNLCEPSRQVTLHLDKGLESPYAENILREMDAGGVAGLKNATDDLLNLARIRTRGFPRALEALVALLTTDYSTTLEEILQKEDDTLPDLVVQKLVGDAFSRLDPTAQKVIQALAVFNRPVPSNALDYLLQPFLPDVDSLLNLQRLLNMHFVRKEAGRYYLHPVDREFAFKRIPDGPNSDHPSMRTEWNRKYLLRRAADYFAKTRKPSPAWKNLDDLYAPLAEFDMHYAAEDYDAAARVLSEIDFDYLLLWSHYHHAFNLYLLVRDKIKDPKIKTRILYGLGTAYRNIGKSKEAIKVLDQGLSISNDLEDTGELKSAILNGLATTYASLGNANKSIEIYKQALSITQQIGNRRRESNILGNLGNRLVEIGEIHIAIKHHEQGLLIAQEINDKYNTGNWLSCLGESYTAIGDFDKAIQLNNDALVIIREINNRTGEIYSLNRLGNAYNALGNIKGAIELQEQALMIAREIGYREGEASSLAAIGQSSLDKNQTLDTINFCFQALQIADEINFPSVQSFARWIIAQSHLLLSNLDSARVAIEQAKSYNVPQHNHNVLALTGIIFLQQGDFMTAEIAFNQTVAQADNLLLKTPEYYTALDAKGLALCGLALSTGKTSQDSLEFDAAKRAFQEARIITRADGVVKHTLRLFDQLAICDNNGLLTALRVTAAGKE